MNLAGFEEDQPRIRLTVNKDFASHYDKSRKSEELMKLKARYGDVKLNDESDTDSETEDEDADELTPAVEQSWLKTLAALKSNDPRIYDEETKFFDSEEEEDGARVKKFKKSRPGKKLTLKDMDRKVITERDGKFLDNSDSEGDEPSTSLGKSYFEEQEAIKTSIKKAQEDVSDEDSDAELLTVKVRAVAEEAEEEEEYLKYVKGQQANVDEEAAERLTALRDFWNREDMTEDDKFLKDYILEKKYRAEESENGDSSSESGSDGERQTFQMLSEDEEEDKNADQFELKYNFRFEEPDPDFIKSYPRTVNTTMRAEKNKRKEKRVLVQERRQKEKQKRREELNRLKNLKRQEIDQKLRSIMKKSGAVVMPFKEEEMDEDFDPDKHDKRMKEMFPDEDDDEEGGNLTKPSFDFDPEIDDVEDWDNYPVANSASIEDGNIPDLEDPSVVMDADYDPNAATLEERNFGLNGRNKKLKRKMSRLRKVLEKRKPLFNPADNKTFDAYVDEYYGLEFEDMIGGDIKCRFPYRQVPANDYGLTVGEILSARDKELNSWSSLKKTVQYRTKEEEYKDITKFRRKSHDVSKKKRLLPSLFTETNELNADEEKEEDKVFASKIAKDSEFAEKMQDSQDTLDCETETTPPAAEKATHKPGTSKDTPSKTLPGRNKRKAKWKGKQKIEKTSEESSSRGMSFKRMEAYGMHSEVKRVKKLKARDKTRSSMLPSF